MNSLSRIWRIGFYSMIALSFVMLFWMIARISLPMLETRLMPVFTKFQLIEAIDIGDGRVEIVVRYTKLRECDLGPAIWYQRGANGVDRELTIERVTDTPRTRRPVGTQDSQPFILDVTREQLLTDVFAVVYSDCWGPGFWLTKSEVYP